MDWTILWWILAALIVISGLVGVVVPALPGIPIMFAGLVLAAWSTDFEPVGWGTIGVLGALTVLSVMIDFLLGAIVGLFFGLVGIVLGPFIGAVAAEMASGSGAQQAGRSGYGVWIGLVLGTAAKMAIAFLMLGIFLTKYIIG